MKSRYRTIFDKIFTVTTGLAVLLLVVVLFVILGPMLLRGFSAVLFKGTVEFRKMQLAEFGHGDPEQVRVESERADAVRANVYELIDNFKSGVDIEQLTDRAKEIYRNYGNELRLRELPREQYTALRSLSREIRNRLTDAFSSNSIEQIREHIEYVLQFEDDERFVNTTASGFFQLARQYQKAAAATDLDKRQEYAVELAELEDIITELLGPSPTEDSPALAQFRYGATRWDQAQKLLHRLRWKERWVEPSGKGNLNAESGVSLVRQEFSRKEQFDGTELEPLFGYIEENIDRMLEPKTTFYWRYFLDDSTPGHYFGGIGPEILGTLLLTLLSMIFVVPFGVISAAYLTECTKEGPIIRIIRMCVNTLAGVPSIVFGLFGVAFFVIFLIPLFGGPSQPCILAGSMTLAVLTLPVMIRSSEEAIRTVPRTYKEASLALGASGFRTFMTVTLPAALPGILTGVILSLSRVAGETAPILFTAGITVGPVPDSIFQKTRTLSYGSWDMAVGDKLSAQVPHNQFGMVVALILLILILNALAVFMRSRVFKRLKGQ
ncbi:MAG: phosphate ABC transporter permease PstA [Sedimentisphaerales bacterium]|nr:phosphate ABC transporter permease PstA [Sedimentisphaerales bacterium]